MVLAITPRSASILLEETFYSRCHFVSLVLLSARLFLCGMGKSSGHTGRLKTNQETRDEVPWLRS